MFHIIVVDHRFKVSIKARPTDQDDMNVSGDRRFAVGCWGSAPGVLCMAIVGESCSQRISTTNAFRPRSLKRPEREARIRLRQLVLPELLGKLWHATRIRRFKGILRTGAILPEPNLPDREHRWFAMEGPDEYPYVRKIGGVSLFDFAHLDPARYVKEYPFGSLYEFVPYWPTWGSAVWIEIDREKVASQLIPASDLAVRWKRDAVSNMILPYIEAAHVGPLPASAFKRAFRVGQGDTGIHLLEIKL